MLGFTNLDFGAFLTVSGGLTLDLGEESEAEDLVLRELAEEPREVLRLPLPLPPFIVN